MYIYMYTYVRIYSYIHMQIHGYITDIYTECCPLLVRYLFLDLCVNYMRP